MNIDDADLRVYRKATLGWGVGKENRPGKWTVK